MVDRLVDIPRAGDLVAGKFRVERVLGQGGMGVVLLATHVELGERFAIKLIPGARSGEPGAVERFRREARAAARLKGEHVARVSDFGTLDDGTPFLVMDYVRGPTLAQELRSKGPLGAAVAAGYLLDACAGLAEAHALGIVHRDVKPANLILSSRPDGSCCVKVLDFGIAKTSTAAGASTLTGTSASLGSPAYMAPEQVRDARSVDARADVWSLGVVLYEALSGRLPFDAFTASGLLAAIVTDPPAPLSSHAPGVAPEVEALVMACLAKDRDARVASVGALAARLGPIAGRDGAWVGRILERPDAVVTADAPAPASLVDDNPTEAPSSLTHDPPTHGSPAPPAPAPSAPSRLSVPLLVGAALLAGAAYAGLRSSPSPAAAPAAVSSPGPSAPLVTPPPVASPAPPSAASPAASQAAAGATAHAAEAPSAGLAAPSRPPRSKAADPPRPATTPATTTPPTPPAPTAAPAPRPAGGGLPEFGGRLLARPGGWCERPGTVLELASSHG